MTKPTPEWLERWCAEINGDIEPYLSDMRDEEGAHLWSYTVPTIADHLTAIYSEVYAEAYALGFNEGSAESAFVAKRAKAKARRETLEEVRSKIRQYEESSPHDDVRFINGVKTWLAEQLKEADGET